MHRAMQLLSTYLCLCLALSIAVLAAPSRREADDNVHGTKQTVFIQHGGKTLLVNSPKDARKPWHLPRGTPKHGEAGSTTGLREANEETGFAYDQLEYGGQTPIVYDDDGKAHQGQLYEASSHQPRGRPTDGRSVTWVANHELHGHIGGRSEAQQMARHFSKHYGQK